MRICFGVMFFTDLTFYMLWSKCYTYLLHLLQILMQWRKKSVSGSGFECHGAGVVSQVPTLTGALFIRLALLCESLGTPTLALPNSTWKEGGAGGS